MRTCTWRRLALSWLAYVAVISFGAQAGRAQTPEDDGQPVAEPRAVFRSDFHFPTGRERFRAYLRDALGAGAVLQSAFVAGTNHFDNAPPEWGHGAQGYGRRLASQFGRSVIQNSIESGLGAILRQDTSYRRCECNGFLRRLGHAVSSDFLARKPDGSRTLTIVKVAGYYGGGMIPMAWYPDRYTATGDGVRLGTISLVAGTGVNIIREFLPQIRKLFHR